MFECIHSYFSLDPSEYNYPLPHESFARYSDRQLRNVGKSWRNQHQGYDLVLSRNCRITFETKITRRNLNTAFLSKEMEDWRIFIEAQLCAADANFVLPILPNFNVDFFKEKLEDAGYCVRLVTDPEETLDGILDQSEKFAIFYRIKNDPKHEQKQKIMQFDHLCPDRFQSSLDFFFANLLDSLYFKNEKMYFSPERKYPQTFEYFRQTMFFYAPTAENKVFLDRWLATCRPYHINFVLFSPSMNYIQEVYLKSVPNVLGNCDLVVVNGPQKLNIDLYPWRKSGESYVVVKNNKKIRAKIPNLPEDLKENQCFVWIRGLGGPLLDEKLSDKEITLE